ncbi:hypothetical protein [Bradyrhizobium japonicum]|uniref:hypothetical protein n=1 Tax=Bradyrhizobium japonicum TaxID=375 RepID=UPI001BAE1D93|nr:hypothetical protein [Bradyrhizobium japonicum]MBR0960892.1 hypothetical protein [Bradyrhizobium japonicum]
MLIPSELAVVWTAQSARRFSRAAVINTTIEVSHRSMIHYPQMGMRVLGHRNGERWSIAIGVMIAAMSMGTALADTTSSDAVTTSTSTDATIATVDLSTVTADTTIATLDASSSAPGTADAGSTTDETKELVSDATSTNSDASESASTSTPILSGDTGTTSTELDGGASSTTEQDTTSSATSTARTTLDIATSSEAVRLDCPMAYTADLYDTPSGHLDPGYSLDTGLGTTTGQSAHKIGTQSWTVCHDAESHTYEFKIAPSDYSGLDQPGAEMIRETVTKLPVQTGVASI